MTAALLLAAWLTPLAVIPLSGRDHGRWWPALAALPALAAALLVPAGTRLDLPWLLLGTQLGLEPADRLFLGFTAVLWLVAGLHAGAWPGNGPGQGRFRVFWLLALSGNTGLLVGQDLLSFYLGFSLMGLAAYGLVVHDGSPAARHAGRVYLAMTLVAELALFLGLLWLYRHAGTLTPDRASLAGAPGAAFALLSLAFAIKAGAPGLHLWLPLAHPAAPVPASAVLSGAMIKAALVGWLRFLPLGETALPELGVALTLAGIAGALLAVPLGLVQRDPKVVLAYSSIAKMGVLTAAVGLAALTPAAAPGIIPALGFYAAYHGLAKGALFLGVGVVKGSPARWPRLALALPALVLAGAPLSAGALAKAQLTAALAAGPGALWVPGLLAAAGVGTGLLMLRVLYLARPAGAATVPPGPATLPWLALVVLTLALPWLGGAPSLPPLTAAWPMALALGLALLAAAPAGPGRLMSQLVGRIPPGDLVAPLLDLWQRLRRRLAGAEVAGPAHWWNRFDLQRLAYRLIAATSRTETALAGTAGTALWLTLVATALVALASVD
jgi:hydrogenase-4 component B